MYYWQALRAEVTQEVDPLGKVVRNSLINILNWTPFLTPEWFVEPYSRYSG
jgi:hypothetical protein